MYLITPAGLELVKENVVQGLHFDEIATFSFKDGSMYWNEDNQVHNIRTCSYTESYNPAKNTCTPCSLSSPDNTYGTFMM
jgi:hypothetical protein